VHNARQVGADDWEIVFHRSGTPELLTDAAPDTPTAARTDNLVHLDVCNLEPPEPMVRILETAAALTPQQTLLIEHHRRPVFLYPQLEAQGFDHETRELAQGRVQLLIWRKAVSA
jgi:hypothetical protein